MCYRTSRAAAAFVTPTRNVAINAQGVKLKILKYATPTCSEKKAELPLGSEIEIHARARISSLYVCDRVLFVY